MAISPLDLQLNTLEAQLNIVKRSVLDGSPAALQTAGSIFQRLAVEFIQCVDALGRAQVATPGRVRRIKALSDGLTSVREGLLRQQAYVERALAIMLPAAPEKTTYTGTSGTYGSATRRSGTFSGFAA